MPRNFVFFTVLTAALGSAVALWVYYSRNFIGLSYEPLSIAIAAGDVDRVKDLAESGEWRFNVYTLLKAIRTNQLGVLKYLIEGYGVPVDVTGIGGNTALIYAAEYMRPEAAAYLLSRGADPNHRNNYGSAVINVATRTLLTHHPELRKVQRAWRIEVVRLLLEAGADIESETSEPLSGTPLHNAIYWDDYELAKFLLEAGADPNHLSANGYPVFLWVRDRQMANLLLSHGADINIAENEDKESVLQFAAKNAEGPERIQLLLESGAEICHRDAAGESVLDYAMRNRGKSAEGVQSLVRERLEAANC